MIAFESAKVAETCTLLDAHIARMTRWLAEIRGQWVWMYTNLDSERISRAMCVKLLLVASWLLLLSPHFRTLTLKSQTKGNRDSLVIQAQQGNQYILRRIKNEAEDREDRCDLIGRAYCNIVEACVKQVRLDLY